MHLWIISLNQKKKRTKLRKNYKSGNTINAFETIIPIPVWFSILPFPISNLEYMDINVEITINPINLNNLK